MFHVELRTGMQVVREFNLGEERLWLQFLAPLMADRDFSVEGHDFTPRRTRLKVYEGPELRPDQLGMGRGWQNVERTATDVTQRVLQRAREHVSGAERSPVRTAAPPASTGAAPTAATAAELLRERLIGRLSAGPLGAEEIAGAAAELLPEASERERTMLAEQAVWALLQRGVAQLTPNGR
ncbi:MAG TPA: hypothetical protein VFN36_06685 [Solirubrobacteraceae bacterium]|nr:hypothetical protein [Solirubrobacteraceae bacterium]